MRTGARSVSTPRMPPMPRPRRVPFVAPAGDRLPSNGELASAFREIADMLDILDEVVYKAVAYRRVADGIERYPGEVAALVVAGTPPKIAGMGPAITARLVELVKTGDLEYLRQLRAQVPPGVIDIVRIPGVGPRTARALMIELGISSIDELRAAAETGSLRSIKGMSARSEERILEGIASLERVGRRFLIHDADRLVAGLIARLRTTPGVLRIEAAGSLRRRAATVGDLDLLAATDDPTALVAALDGLPEVDRILAAGTDKTSITLADGPQVDLMLCGLADWGSHLVHFTGSRDHNVALRGRALDRGLSLSEKGFKVVDTGELLMASSEEDVYERLDLDWIAPELREDQGEIAAAETHTLPVLIERSDIRGDTHVHSDWTDGVHSIDTMARAARDAGLEYMVLTDHSPSLGVTRGLSVARMAEQAGVIADLNTALAPFRILRGTEMEIHADGSLDYDDEVLASLDVVIASIHSGRSQPMAQLTERALAAIENPHVDVLAHPTGRIVNQRDPAPLDWPRVFEAAARTGTLLEVNGSPRLDLDDTHARLAAAIGVGLTVASDAHRTTEFEYLDYGVSVARRAWLSRDQVATTRSADDLLARLR